MIPRTVDDLFERLGSELDDLSLAYGTDGRITQARAIRALNQAAKKVWSAFKADGIDPMNWKQEVSPTVDANDSNRYPLPPRTRQVMMVKDDNSEYQPLGTFRTGGCGYVVEEGCRAVRLRNQTVQGTLDTWIIQEPVAMSASNLATDASTTTITLAATASIGTTVLEDDYYNGAYVAITSGTGQGEIKKITDYVGSTRVATVDSAWTNTPTTGGSSRYSIVTDIPAAGINAQVLRAALQLVRSDETMKEFYSDLRDDYQAAYRDALMLMHNANMTKVDQPLNISDLVTSNNGEYV